MNFNGEGDLIQHRFLKRAQKNKYRLLSAAFVFLFFLPATSFAFCFKEAGEEYGINPALLQAIANVEGGDPSAVHRNKNGSYDFGVMQINSFWASVLGLDAWSQLRDPCTNVRTGAWILAQCMNRHGYSWEGVGCYNATDPEKRARYARRVATVLQKEMVYENRK